MFSTDLVDDAKIIFSILVFVFTERSNLQKRTKDHKGRKNCKGLKVSRRRFLRTCSDFFQILKWPKIKKT